MTKEIKRESKIAARIPKELKEKVTKLNHSKKYKYLTESDIVCLALEEFVDKYGEEKNKGVEK